MTPIRRRKVYGQSNMANSVSTGEETSFSISNWSVKYRSILFLERLRRYPWYEDFQNIMRHYLAREYDVEIVLNKVGKLFQGRRELILEFNSFLPEGYEITLPQKRKNGDNDNAVVAAPSTDDFNLEKVTGVENKNVKGVLTLSRVEVVSQKMKCDVLDDDSTTTSGDDNGDESLEHRKLKVIDFYNMIAEINPDGLGVCESFVHIFMDTISKRNKSTPSNSSLLTQKDELQIYKKIVKLLQDHPNFIEFTSYLAKAPLLSAIVDKDMTCAPSYRRNLPKTSPDIFPVTENTDLASEVLNDSRACMGSTSSVNSREGGRINSEHEKKLFKCADRQCAYDVFHSRVKSAMRNIEELRESLESSTTTPSTSLETAIEVINKYLTVIDQCEIKRVCLCKQEREEGIVMMEALMRLEQWPMPLILGRLKEDEDKLERKHHELEEMWAEVYGDDKKDKRRRRR